MPETELLVVEDEAGTRATLCGILEEAGYRVVGLEVGADALKIMKNKNFDNIPVVDRKKHPVGIIDERDLMAEGIYE